MTLTLRPETETRLRTVAEGRGLDPAQVHEDLLGQALAAAEAEARAARLGLFERWAEDNARGLPLLSDEAISRAAIYGDR